LCIANRIFFIFNTFEASMIMNVGKTEQAFLSKKKQLALLIDPDKLHRKGQGIANVMNVAKQAAVDFIFVGGSLTSVLLDSYIAEIRQLTTLPIIIFPGSLFQISFKADAVLFISLISGRNPEYLIGHHVVSAGLIKNSPLEAIPTGYILIESGKVTSVQYISSTIPIPADKPDIVAATAMAGEMLGLRHIYLDAGSGALHPISAEIISEVRKNISIPLIVGGGIRSAHIAEKALRAGADILVVGTVAEENADALNEIAEVVKKFNE